MKGHPKVLFIMHMPPPVHGAAVVGKQIYDSPVIRSAFECIFLNPAASGRVDEIGHFSFRKIWAMIRFYGIVQRTVRKEQPQLVYITPSTWDWGFYRDCLTVLLLKSNHCSIVAHFHNKPKLSFTRKWYNKWLYKHFFNQIDVIFLAAKLADTFSRYIAPERMHVCPNGIPGSASATIPVTHDTYTFLFVSNMMQEKGVDVLLDACALLKEKGLRFCCKFVGRWSDISEDDFVNRCSNLHVEDCVSALGAKYGQEKDACFAQADAFVFPTFYHGECLSLVVLEAMQHSLPVITTAEGALSEVVDDGKTGFVVAKQDSLHLAEKMQFLIEHPEMGREMGAKGLAKYKNEYTAEVFENRLCSILYDCIQNN